MAAVSKLSDLVSPEEIRALLGASAKELPDERVDLPIYLKIVKSAVGALDTQRRIWLTYEELPDTGLTPAQVRFKDAFETFVGLKTASAIAVSLPASGFRSLTDGKAALTREPGSAEKVMTNLESALADAAYELSAAAAELLPVTPVTASVVPFIGTATPGLTDPVTGV